MCDGNAALLGSRINKLDTFSVNPRVFVSTFAERLHYRTWWHCYSPRLNKPKQSPNTREMIPNDLYAATHAGTGKTAGLIFGNFRQFAMEFCEFDAPPARQAQRLPIPSYTVVSSRRSRLGFRAAFVRSPADYRGVKEKGPSLFSPSMLGFRVLKFRVLGLLAQHHELTEEWFCAPSPSMQGSLANP